MTKKTLYISDLDGTLLNSQSQVSAASRDMLNRLIADNGINFSIATARTPATVVQPRRNFSLVSISLTSNCSS